MSQRAWNVGCLFFLAMGTALIPMGVYFALLGANSVSYFGGGLLVLTGAGIVFGALGSLREQRSN